MLFHLVRLYRSLISPILHSLYGPGMGCRFEPSCSAFAEEALQIHGSILGSRLILGRLLRCQPFSQAGYDPVPRVIAKPYFKPHPDQGR